MSTLAEAKQCVLDHDIVQAEKICEQLLQTDPDHAEAWHLRGVTHAEQGNLQEAADCFQKAGQIDSQSALYPYNLGLALKMLGKFGEAVDAYQLAIERNEDFLEARNNLGTALIAQRRDLEAADCFRELVRRHPDSADSHFNLANTLQDIGQTDESIEHFRRTIQLQAEHSAARENLGRALTDADRHQDAKEVWEQWLEFDPDNGIARHMLCALTGQETPLRCDDDYIRATFHQDFATNFDQQLLRLDYRTPALVGKALQAIDRPLVDLEVLDAGCGTGLCGPIVRPLAANLIGVDLSAAMLDQAKKRDLYDQVIECEITEFMNSNPDGFDLMIASDTLCYFGDLNEVLSAASTCLRKEGRMVFTVEAAEDQAESYKLQQHGRYCHTEAYVRKAVEAAGFQVTELSTDVQRLEAGRPVEGFIVTAKR